MMSNKFCLNIEALIFNFFYEVALKYFDNLVTKNDETSVGGYNYIILI